MFLQKKSNKNYRYYNVVHMNACYPIIGFMSC